MTNPHLLNIIGYGEIKNLTKAYHTNRKKERGKEEILLRHGKKPTRKQKIRLSQVGLSPENWLVMNQKQDGELVIIHKHTDKIRVVPAPVG